MGRATYLWFLHLLRIGAFLLPTFMFQDLKALLTNIKTEFEDLQSKFQTDLRELGKFFSTLRE